jgi:glycosyltransferase involved in cell wall biosynthesis
MRMPQSTCYSTGSGEGVRVVHANVVRPRERIDPERLLADWPTLGDVAGAVARAGAEVTVVQALDRNATIEAEGVRYRFVAEPAMPRRATGAMPWRIARAVRGCRPDAIHVNGLDFAVHTRMLCGLGVPVLVQDHASTPERRRLRRRWGLAKVAGMAFTDAAQAESFVANGSLRRDVPVFSVPESSTRFRPGDRDEARAASRIHGDPAVLWVGRLDANKDPLTILDAIEIAARALPGVQLWCCFHEQPLLAEVRARIAGSDALAGRVHLLGRVPHEHIETLCRAADFFMLGSRREGSGYALIEAMACGAAPIVSDIAPFRRLTGGVGALAPVGDTAAFAAGLIRLAAEPRQALRRRVAAHFRDALSFETIGARLLDIYAELIGVAR